MQIDKKKSGGYKFTYSVTDPHMVYVIGIQLVTFNMGIITEICSYPRMSRNWEVTIKKTDETLSTMWVEPALPTV